MQKFDGDITSIFFNLLPKIILAKMFKENIINEKQKVNLLNIFEGKVSYTNTKNSKSLHNFFSDEFEFDYLHDPEIFCIYIDYLKVNPKSINNSTNITIKEKTYENIYNYKIDIILKTYEKKTQNLKKIQEITQNISFKL
jgi:hypothetical protein